MHMVVVQNSNHCFGPRLVQAYLCNPNPHGNVYCTTKSVEPVLGRSHCRNSPQLSAAARRPPALICSKPESRFWCRDPDVQASRENPFVRSPENPAGARSHLWSARAAPYRSAGGNFSLEVIKIAKFTPIRHRNSTKLFHNVH